MQLSLQLALSRNAVVRQLAEKIATLQQLATTFHSVSPLQQFSLQLVLQSRCETSGWENCSIAATCNAFTQCITPSATFLAIFETLSNSACTELFTFIFIERFSSAKFVRILEQVKTFDCISGFHWSALEFSQTFASVFTRLWRHGKHVLFLNCTFNSCVSQFGCFIYFSLLQRCLMIVLYHNPWRRNYTNAIHMPRERILKPEETFHTSVEVRTSTCICR